MTCSDCNEPIRGDEKTATGPDGVVHYRCFKRGTAAGKEITLDSLAREIGRLKRRVQQLEQTSAEHERNIDFRIGGCE